MEKINATGPDGLTRALPAPQFRRLWQVWRAVAPVAAARGEGVRVAEKDGDLLVETVYAPLYEAVGVEIAPDGGAGWYGEQNAPDLPGLDLTAPPPAGPWERAAQ